MRVTTKQGVKELALAVFQKKSCGDVCHRQPDVERLEGWLNMSHQNSLTDSQSHDFHASYGGSP